MRRMAWIVALSVVGGSGAPTVSGILNGGSFVQGPIAPGTIVSIFGSGLARIVAQASTLPLPHSLDGTRVTVNGQSAPLFFVSPNQINLQLPFQLQSGSASLSVIDATGASGSRALTIAATSPAIFTTSSDGKGEAISVHANFKPVRKVTLENAGIGETIILFCTGLGALDNFSISGAIAPSAPLARTTQTATVLMDGRAAQVSFSGLAPGFIGLYQINFVVPPGVGGDVATTVVIGGVASNPATINVRGTFALAANYSGQIEYRTGAKYALELNSFVTTSPTRFQANYRLLNGTAGVDNGSFLIDSTQALFTALGKSSISGRAFVGVMDTLDAGKSFIGILYDTDNIEKITDFDGWYAGFQFSVVVPPPPPVVPAPVLPGVSTACAAVEGLLVYASDRTFLGRITSNAFAADSIGNTFGAFGSQFSTTSIFNTFGQYGSEFSSTSAFNNLASSPPLLYRGTAAVAFLTTNQFKTPQVDPRSLYPCIGRR